MRLYVLNITDHYKNALNFSKNNQFTQVQLAKRFIAN